MDSMRMILLKSFIAAGGLATVADAHMKLRLPAPYTSPAINNSPITNNYPCQFPAGLDASALQGVPTEMKKGSTQQMGFTGGASHSGGSCQVSLTYDKVPNAKSAFKVIHSIHGGCPAKNANGNIGNDAEAPAPDTYEFTIPSDIPDGNATLAWSWLSRSGGVREFYMNCAPVSITGGGGDEAALAALPDMFVANVPSVNDCKTTENFDTEYPNPGKSLDDSFAEKALKAPICGAGGAGDAGAPAGPAATPAVRGRRPGNFRA